MFSPFPKTFQVYVYTNQKAKNMGARSSRSRNQNPDVSKVLKGKLICLTREDSYLQDKSLLYSKMKSIERGKVKLPIPLSKINKECFCFVLKLNGDIKIEYSF